MRGRFSIPIAVLIGVAIHVDWHLARAHDHGGLSGGLPYHWLLAVPIFALAAWHLTRRFDRPVPAASITIWVGMLLGQGVEPLSEILFFDASFAEAFAPDRLAAFAAFMTAGIAAYVVVAWRLRALRRAAIIAALIGLPVSMSAQQPEPLDGPNRIFQDSLLERLTGNWTITGTIRGQPATQTLHAEWVLHHQFLRLDMRDVNEPPAYQATVYIGYDNLSERYVVHWLDGFGGRFSETLGYGRRDGNAIRFMFEYPDGPFTNTFTLDPRSNAWSWLLRTKRADGTWGTFAELKLARR
jgi:hypothetical protein